MRTIEHTGQFKRDFKREAKGRHRNTVADDLMTVLQLLINNQSLPEKYYDHALSGDKIDHRDCHIKPDLVLIYRQPSNEVLQLVRLGSHSELGL
ncbi:MAG: type II toxin-antitoxin system YafQ family toxin [Gallionella sp.]